MEGYPINTCSAAALPLLIQARAELHRLAAPQASRIAERIGRILEEIIDVAGDVEAYGNKWSGGRMGELAEALNAAAIAYHQVDGN